MVRQLLEPAVRAEGNGDASSAFDGAAASAAPLLDVTLADPRALPAGPEASATIVHALYRLTANLASRRPLALLVDDAHWADAASLRFLAYVGRRLDGLPILLVVAARPRGQHGGRAVAELLAKDDADGALRPAPLSDAGTTRLVRARAARRSGGAVPGLSRGHRRQPVLPARVDHGAPGSRHNAGGRRVERRAGRGGRGAWSAAGQLPAVRPRARGRGVDPRRRCSAAAREPPRGARPARCRAGGRRAPLRPDPRRRAPPALPAPDHPHRRASGASRRRALGRPPARRTAARGRGRSTRACGRSPAPRRARRVGVGLRAAPRGCPRGASARGARGVGHLPAPGARGAACGGGPSGRAARARVGRGAHPRRRAGHRAPAARRRHDGQHARAPLRRAHALVARWARRARRRGGDPRTCARGECRRRSLARGSHRGPPGQPRALRSEQP